MNEPTHPHFVLSDGMYCHVLEDGLLVSKKFLPEKRPAQNDQPDLFGILMLIAGIALAAFFIVMSALASFFVVVFMLGAFSLLMLYYLAKNIGFSQSKFIPRGDILNVEYFKRNFGYDTFIVHYTGKDGTAKKRRFIIYDSNECLAQALKVMKEEGLMKA